MEIQPGDVLEMKKEHPCGSRQWEVLRVLPRRKAEKAVKKIIPSAPRAD